MPISTVWILKYVQQRYVKWFWTISSLGAPFYFFSFSESESESWFDGRAFRSRTFHAMYLAAGSFVSAWDAAEPHIDAQSEIIEVFNQRTTM